MISLSQENMYSASFLIYHNFSGAQPMASGPHVLCPIILDMASKVDPKVARSVVIYLQYADKKKQIHPLTFCNLQKCKVDRSHSHNALKQLKPERKFFLYIKKTIKRFKRSQLLNVGQLVGMPVIPSIEINNQNK